MVNHYRDALSQATPHAPSHFQQKSPRIASAIHKTHSLFKIAWLWLQAKKISKTPLVSECMWKYTLLSELFNLAQIPSRLHKNLENPEYVTSFGGVDMAIAWLWLVFDSQLKNTSRKKVLQKAINYINNLVTIRSYVNMPQFKENPQLLLSAIHHIPVWDFQGKITAQIQKYNIIFYIENDEDYIKIHGGWRESALKSWWFFSPFWGNIEALKGCITYQRGVYRPGAKLTMKHEERHTENHILRDTMPRKWVQINKWLDKQNLTRMLELTKDEIIAYMTDRDEDDMSIYLKLHLPFESDAEHLYDYRNHLWLIDNREKLTEEYNKSMYQLIQIAFGFKKAQIPNFLDLLSITPAKNWSLIESGFLNSKWHVKYNASRQSPYYFNHCFQSLQDEQQVLQEMYQIYPKYIIKPLYIDPNENFYITEKYGTNDIEKVLYISDIIFESIKEVVLWLHAVNIAHGDLLGNILFEIDEKWVATGFKIIDPVGISQWVNSQFLEQAKNKDIDSLNRLSSDIWRVMIQQTSVQTML